MTLTAVERRQKLNPSLVPAASALVLHLATALPLSGQPANFLGVMGGIATLSADGRSVVTGTATAISQYKPENGPTMLVLAGRQFKDYLSVQASYGWNRNDVLLTSADFSGTARIYEQGRENSMHTLLGEAMLYFLGRDSLARPYLSAGVGFIRHRSVAGTRLFIQGGATPPPEVFAENSLAFRVAVGIDLRIKGPLAFRYSFAETIQDNALSKRLSPPGKRKLANFQNLWGIVWAF